MQQVAQQRLALLKSAAGDVLTAEVQEVEREVRQQFGPAPFDRIVQTVQVRYAALIGRGDLAVDHERHAELGEAGHRGTELRRNVEPVPRSEDDASLAISDGGNSVPVVLYLVEPAVARWRLGCVLAD
jgi:hypothetical protein